MFAAGKTASSGTQPDAQFNYVTMLLHGDGTNGAQNNTFLDSSTNNFTITRNGNTTQGSFSPYGSNWCNYFDGSGDYLNFTGTGFNFGTGAFTLEGWVYLTAYNYGSVIATWNSGTDVGFLLGFDNIGRPQFNIGNAGGASTDVQGSTAIPLNTWTYLAATKTAGSGGTMTLYVNGVSVGTSTTTRSLDRTATVIGRYYQNIDGNYTFGYLSNIRVSNIVRSISTPTSPLTTDGNTLLLTCQSNRFIDTSTNNFTITANGNTSVQRFNPFGASTAYSTSVIGGSGYFDGSGDYLTTSSATAFSLGSSDFTFEAWVNFSAATDANGDAILTIGDGTSNRPVSIYRDTSKVFVDLSTGGTNLTSITFSATFASNSWNHIAIVRNSNTIYCYVNGVSIGTPTAYSSTIASYTSTVYVGRIPWNGAADMVGYISDLRLVKGTAVYTSNFTPPTTPLTAVTNTSLLLGMTNGAIFDNAMTNDLETVGVAQISTSVVKYGTGSISFGSVVGNDNYLLAPATPNLEFGSGDFTIEFWWYPISTARQALYHGSFGVDWSIGIDYSSVSTNQKIGIWASSNGTSWNLINADPSGNGIGTTTLTQNAWNHIAFVRNGTTWMLFVNGNRDLNLTSISGSIVDRSAYKKGINVWWAASALNEASGYMDDFRITKGYARYTANFTPPTAAFPNTGPI